MVNGLSDQAETTAQKLVKLSVELEQELEAILAYWLKNMVDETNGGFYGKRLFNETLVADAPKGVVLNARILWSFAAAARHSGENQYVLAAERAYNYLVNNFIDAEFGGVYWSVDYAGKPLDTKKQVYALSFALYGLAEYYRLTGNEAAKQHAIDLFYTIEKCSRDTVLGGYIEAFTRNWQPIDDLRLSDKDANEKKTMNTHLHVLEAYSNLYRIYPEPVVKNAITDLLSVFLGHIIDASNHHLVLFFNDQWVRKGTQISYGHDIEAAWLLCEAATVISNKTWIDIMQLHAVKIADASIDGIDTDGGMWHEYDPATSHLQREKHWWPQSEAMVGFINAFEITGNEYYATLALNSWQFIKAHIKDTENGEWVWGVNGDYSLMNTEDKAGFWKCPYHNSRACLEVIDRIRNLQAS